MQDLNLDYPINYYQLSLNLGDCCSLNQDPYSDFQESCFFPDLMSRHSSKQLPDPITPQLQGDDDLELRPVLFDQPLGDLKLIAHISVSEEPQRPKKNKKAPKTKNRKKKKKSKSAIQDTIYCKNICRNLIRKCIRSLQAQTYARQAAQICAQTGCQQKCLIRLLTVSIEKLSGPRALADFCRHQDKSLAHGFLAYLNWYLKERYLRQVIAEGQMKDMTRYLQFKNSVLLPLMQQLTAI